MRDNSLTMILSRRSFLASTAAIPAAAFGATEEKRVIPHYEEPFLDLHRHVKQPVKIAKIELLQNGKNYFLRTESADGAVGVCKTKDIEDYIPILENRVIPVYHGRDARDLEALVDEVYVKNYKLAGQAFWCPVAYVEQSLFDMLGKIANKPAGELFGGIVRTEIPVYLSGSGRETTAEEEVDVYVKGVEKTGAGAVKFKIGGRMSRNLDTYPGRTETMMKLARKRLGDAIVLYADANGSYNAEKAIEVGKFIESLNVKFFEEPCPWEELGETKKVADTLAMPIAGGEQDASLWRFQWMIDNGVVQIVQPDLSYNGGFIRALRVARMAARKGLPITPHNTQTGASSVNMLQFASAVKNIGPHMEYAFRGKYDDQSWYTPHFHIVNGKIPVPKGPGLGVEIDPEYLKKAKKVVG